MAQEVELGAGPPTLLQRASRPRVAYGLLGAVAVGYSLVAFELSAANASPMPDPYLRISNHSYFLWGTLFYGPVLVGGWLLAAGVLYLLASAFKSAPRFDEVLRWSALAVGAGTLGTLVPDLVTSTLRAIGVIDEQAWERSMVAHGGWFAFTWVTLIIYVALFFVAYPVAARHGARLRSWKAIVAGLASFVVYQGFLFVFIR